MAGVDFSGRDFEGFDMSGIPDPLVRYPPPSAYSKHYNQVGT